METLNSQSTRAQVLPGSICARSCILLSASSGGRPFHTWRVQEQRSKHRLGALHGADLQVSEENGKFPFEHHSDRDGNAGPGACPRCDSTCQALAARRSFVLCFMYRVDSSCSAQVAEFPITSKTHAFTIPRSTSFGSTGTLPATWLEDFSQIANTRSV